MLWDVYYSMNKARLYFRAFTYCELPVKFDFILFKLVTSNYRFNDLGGGNMENKNKNEKLFIYVVETIIVMLLLGFVQDPYVLALSLLATILIIEDDEDGENPSDK